MKGTTVSEASRRDANSGKDRHTLKDAIQQLEQEQSERSKRKMQLELEIMAINGRFNAGERFRDGEYQQVLDRQHDIKVALKGLELANREAKLRKKALEADLQAGSGDNTYKAASNDLLMRILGELKAIRKLLAKEEKADDQPARQP